MTLRMQSSYLQILILFNKEFSFKLQCSFFSKKYIIDKTLKSSLKYIKYYGHMSGMS